LRKLTIVFHDGGGGHRSAADALRTTLTTQARPWDVSLLNLQELLDSLDLFRSVTGLRTQDIYNRVLRKGWTRLTPQMLKVLQRVIRLYHPRLLKALRAYWTEHPTDLVLSVIPHFNRALAESIKSAAPETPFVTLITDLADYPPHFWIEPESEYIIAGSERAKEQALAMGHPPHHIFEASGMVLKPKFYEPTSVDRPAERKKLDLDANLPTGIVLFGGYGSQVMVDIARKLDRSDIHVQLILLCGHNQKLAAKLKSLKNKMPTLVVGFTPNVEYYMALADFFIGKPGPGSISEALQFHLPVIVECNKKTLPQERYNAEWVTEKHFGVVVASFRKIGSSVEKLLQSSAFDEFRRNVATYSNRALFEIPKFLDQCQKAGTSAI
jgi:1,2-diacylglycerol 3-beta-galactosyltransferase